ncbi:hypothetical protein U9M48_026501 [Paspalum notatum var. saurae]|uniref:Uncharacterized protein n=1 Tax=Paspalum notatum var. saurae TaxID=547442 RepID=A0AAQ3WZA1_PASNO
MDKVLAFSIPSASPADISADGTSVHWTRLSWRRGADADQAVVAAAASQQQRARRSSVRAPMTAALRAGGGAARGDAESCRRPPHLLWPEPWPRTAASPRLSARAEKQPVASSMSPRLRSHLGGRRPARCAAAAAVACEQ